MKNQPRALICCCVSIVFLELLIHVKGWTLPHRITKLWQRQPKIVQFSHQDAADESTVDRYFMQRALDSAQKAAKAGEVPVGALIVRNITAMELEHRNRPHNNSKRQTSVTFDILSVAVNRVERDFDASAHAELLALRQAARQICNWRLQYCTLYSTLEPCPMCLSAALAFRMDRLVYGASDLRLGAVETYQQMLQQPHPFHNISLVRAGIYQEESACMLREFFRTRRRQQVTSQSKENDT